MSGGFKLNIVVPETCDRCGQPVQFSWPAILEHSKDCDITMRPSLEWTEDDEWQVGDIIYQAPDLSDLYVMEIVKAHHRSLVVRPYEGNKILADITRCVDRDDIKGKFVQGTLSY